MNKKYTVVGVYPNEGKTVTHHVEAEDPEGAVRAFWGTLEDEDDGVSVAEVFEGHIESVMPYVVWVDPPGSGGYEVTENVREE